MGRCKIAHPRLTSRVSASCWAFERDRRLEHWLSQPVELLACCRLQASHLLRTCCPAAFLFKAAILGFAFLGLLDLAGTVKTPFDVASISSNLIIEKSFLSGNKFLQKWTIRFRDVVRTSTRTRRRHYLRLDCSLFVTS
jgi:hypothetical protein